LRNGELRRQVAAFLAGRPGEEFTPGAVARALSDRSAVAAVIEDELRTIVEIQDVGTIAVDHILHAHQELLDKLRTRRVLGVGFAVEHLRVHALPPPPLAIGDGLHAVVRDPGVRPVGIALVSDRKKFIPGSVWGSVIAHAKSQPVGTRDLGPCAHDVALWANVNAIPGLIF
jgi:hypothetical protein